MGVSVFYQTLRCFEETSSDWSPDSHLGFLMESLNPEGNSSWQIPICSILRQREWCGVFFPGCELKISQAILHPLNLNTSRCYPRRLITLGSKNHFKQPSTHQVQYIQGLGFNSLGLDAEKPPVLLNSNPRTLVHQQHLGVIKKRQCSGSPRETQIHLLWDRDAPSLACT